MSTMFRFLMLLLLCSFTPAFATPTTPDSDFTDNGDGTVTHKITGLIWKRCAEGQTWNGNTCTGNADTYAYDEALKLTSNFAGKSDWRLPNIAELHTIVEREKYMPAINTNMFSSAPVGWFWSASTYAKNPNNAWFANFSSGGDSDDDKNNSNRVRLVRGGQLLDPSGNTLQLQPSLIMVTVLSLMKLLV